MVGIDRRATVLHDEHFSIPFGRASVGRPGSSQPLVVRDILEKPNDVIWQPHAQIGRSWSSVLGVSALSFKTEGSIYINNPSFSNAYYRLDFKQELQLKKTVLELIYRYTPHQLLGSWARQFTGEHI